MGKAYIEQFASWVVVYAKRVNRAAVVGQGGAWGKAGANNHGHLSYPGVKEKHWEGAKKNRNCFTLKERFATLKKLWPVLGQFYHIESDVDSNRGISETEPETASFLAVHRGQD